MGGGTRRERGNKENKYEQINMRTAEWVGRQRQSALVKKNMGRGFNKTYVELILYDLT